MLSAKLIIPSAPSRARTGDPLIKSRTGADHNSSTKQQLTPHAAARCSAGCSEQQGEGGIPDADLAALVAAFLSVLAWLLRLSFLVSFISETILIGFKAGAALTIAMM